MPRVTKVIDHVHETDGTITLDETARHRRRMAMTSDAIDGKEGIAFLLDLPEARLLRHGEGLVLDDGRVIEVRAAPEPLLEVRARDTGHLVQLAWQLGNRHLPAQVFADRILIRRDHVIADMLKGLGAQVAEIDGPFDPEGGAYGGHSHGHDHSHGPDHGHDHHHHHHHGHVPHSHD
ncbi:urease accessory protein UreE [Tepidamorphus sp. 3E244]|uniref:urease accessory protein UreE n=1 Tax=Tepidamorphus sp. 3E244 TaxID=3385498 RepID=UPI0038FC1458